MTIRQIIFISVASAALTLTDFSLQAEPLTPAQALARVAGSGAARRMPGLFDGPERELSLRSTLKTRSGVNALYLFT